MIQAIIHYYHKTVRTIATNPFCYIKRTFIFGDCLMVVFDFITGSIYWGIIILSYEPTVDPGSWAIASNWYIQHFPMLIFFPHFLFLSLQGLGGLGPSSHAPHDLLHFFWTFLLSHVHFPLLIFFSHLLFLFLHYHLQFFLTYYDYITLNFI